MITIQNKNMKHPTLKILIGIPASGKSTWSKEFVSKNDNWCIVSSDDFRYAWQNKGFCDTKIENLISEMVDVSIEKLIAKGINVIYDATNVKASYLDHFKNLVKHTAKVEFQLFDVPFETAVERDSKRERSVGEEVIKKMYQSYLVLLDSYDFSFQIPTPKKYIAPVFDPKKKNCIIVDIDGTLAHTSGKRSPYDYSKVDVDDLDVSIRKIAQATLTGLNDEYSGEYCDLIILSGREDLCRNSTVEWLEKNNIFYDELFMRKTGDRRKDSIIKEEIFWEHIEPNYNVIAVFDDRDQVVKMWRSLGLKCLQVDYGNF